MTKRQRTKLVLHIGDPKTGTSSIQRAIERNSIQCEDATIGGFVRENGSANAISTARAFSPKRKGKSRKVGDELNAWLNKSENDYSILSSEFFSGADVPRLKRVFSNRMSDYAQDAKIIAYARPHAGRFLAAFVQRTKNGLSTGDFESSKAKLFTSGFIDYTPRFASWRDAFGDRFVLRPFVRSELVEGDIVADFFTEVLGDRQFTINQTFDENISPTERALAGLRVFNRTLQERGIPAQGRDRLSKEIHRNLPKDPAPDRTKPKLDRATVSEIADKCMDDAKLLDSTFFKRPLFQTDLEKAIDNAPTTPIDVSPDTHFSQDEQEELQDLSRQVADAVTSEVMPQKVMDTVKKLRPGASKFTLPSIDSGLRKKLDRIVEILA